MFDFQDCLFLTVRVVRWLQFDKNICVAHHRDESLPKLNVNINLQYVDISTNADRIRTIEMRVECVPII